jgi:hypothetical protein
MNQLVYSRKFVPARQGAFLELLKAAFRATPLGLFIAAIRNSR